MNTIKYIYIFISLIIFLTIECNNKPINKSKQSHVIELTEDGSWGYAGRFAYVVDNKLLFSYIDSKGYDWASSFDFNTNKIERNNIWEGESDLHSANPLLVRPDGRIQIFLDVQGYSDKTISWKVSSEPYSIKQFDEIKTSKLERDIIQGRQFYPMVHQKSGSVYLVINGLRDGSLRETVMWKSPDGGDTWTEYNNLWGLGKGLKGNRCYTRTYMKDNYIHFVTARVGWGETLDRNEIGRVEGIYYTKFNVNDKNFYHSDGTKSFNIEDVPVYDTKYFDEIWHWDLDGKKQYRALWSDIVSNEDDKPYVAFTLQRSVEQGRSATHKGYWATTNKEGKWFFSEVTEIAKGWDNSPERKNYAIAIDPEDPSTVYVSKSKSNDGRISQVVRMQTMDEGKSWIENEVFSVEGMHSTIVIPKVLDKSQKVTKILWLEGELNGWRDYNTKINSFIIK